MQSSHFVIVDLEATCCNNNEFPRDEMEIIEIGAVALDKQTLEIIADFQTFIQPVRHSTLTEFCRTLTTITDDDLASAPNYATAIAQFSAWLKSFPQPLFCSWGDYDKRQFQQDCEFHQVAYPFSSDHLNIKREFAKQLKLNKPVELVKALNLVGLSMDGTLHRGIDDARNMARLAHKIWA